MIILQKFNNLVQLFTYFNNEQVCRDYLEQIRWNGNITCPYEDCKVRLKMILRELYSDLDGVIDIEFNDVLKSII